MYVRSINSYLTWLHDEGHADAPLRVKLLRVTLPNTRCSWMQK